MANQPVIRGTCQITYKDINGNNIAKNFNNVLNLNFDYNTGKINVVDVTGSFYFGLSALTTLTYTIVANPNGVHASVMS